MLIKKKKDGTFPINYICNFCSPAKFHLKNTDIMAIKTTKNEPLIIIFY